MNKEQFLEWVIDNEYIDFHGEFIQNLEDFNNFCIDQYQELARNLVSNPNYLTEFELDVLIETYYKSITSFGCISEIILDCAYIEDFNIILFGNIEEIIFELDELNSKLLSSEKITYYTSDNYIFEY